MELEEESHLQVLPRRGERRRTPETEGGPHILRVIFETHPFKIELEAGAVCSVCDSCLLKVRGFDLLIEFLLYAYDIKGGGK